jgi:hypothetical protein
MAQIKHQTQWAAQFAVASELCKLNYQVALTLGNHPTADLMVISPTGRNFVIDVKGLYKPNPFPVQPKYLRDDLFYIFVYVPENKSNEFFIMTQNQVNDATAVATSEWRIKNGLSVATKDPFPVVRWKAVQSFKDKWKELPP